MAEIAIEGARPSRQDSGLSVRAVKVIEFAFIVPLVLAMLIETLPFVTSQPFLLFFLTCEMLNAVLLLIQRPGQTSRSAWAMIIALVASSAGPLLHPSGAAFVSQQVSFILTLSGLTMAIAAKLFLGRRFGLTPANRGICRTGPYRLVRHPMYLGYFITQVGYIVYFLSWHNAIILAVGWAVQAKRVLGEEKLLMQDPEYREFASKTRWRVIPGIF